MPDTFQLSGQEELGFRSGTLYVDLKPFLVTLIDGDPPDGPVCGFDGQRVLTLFRGHLTNEWESSTVEGVFYPEFAVQIDRSICSIEDRLMEIDGATAESMRFIIDALRTICKQLVEV